jgi:hypothetical protein
VEGKDTCCFGRFSGRRASAQVRYLRSLVFFGFDTAFPGSVFSGFFLFSLAFLSFLCKEKFK